MIPAAVHTAALISAFAICWFLALFCVFPIGLGEVNPDTGAPLNPRIGLKMLIATGVATVCWCVFYALIVFHVIDI
ncbi:MAG TPA: DUF1467 family protein [Rhizomicrobium sp.]|nr:DUF1467 family protein [Rhizomicrobium sp.]